MKLLLLCCVLVLSSCTLTTENANPRYIGLANSQAPKLLVTASKSKRQAIFLLEATREDITWWLSSDGVQLIIRAGQLIGTRGLSGDLMFFDADGQGKSEIGYFVRGRFNKSSVTCANERTENYRVQTCSGPSIQWENQYFYSEKGLSKSVQHVSPDVGFFTLQWNYD